ncbi:hypothetical protein LR066_01455 [candidate division WOR-3 bacterium]|nr:hypothetical protein [candidate division WOR-3 bacterium]
MLSNCYKRLLILLSVPGISFAIEIGGGLCLPLGDVGDRLPMGGYLEMSLYRQGEIKPLVGIELASLGVPPSNINIYRLVTGVRYRIFELRLGYYLLHLRFGRGEERETGPFLSGRVLIPFGNGGGYANISLTSVPFGIGTGIVFNLPWMQGE